MTSKVSADLMDKAINNNSKEQFQTWFSNYSNESTMLHLLIYGLYRLSSKMENSNSNSNLETYRDLCEFIIECYKNNSISNSDEQTDIITSNIEGNMMNIVNIVKQLLSCNDHLLCYKFMSVLSSGTLNCLINYLYSDDFAPKSDNKTDYLLEIAKLTLELKSK